MAPFREHPEFKKIQRLLEHLAEYGHEPTLLQWEEDRTLAENLDHLLKALHAAALHGPIMSAVSIEADIGSIMTVLGTNRWKPGMGIRELALPARHTALLCELARASEPRSLAEICHSGDSVYAQFYEGQSVTKMYRELCQATGLLDSTIVRGRGHTGHPRIWWLTPNGRDALRDGALGPTFSSFSNAFKKLSTHDQERYFQLWGKFVGNGGAIPPWARGIASEVKAYAVLGIAERMLGKGGQKLISAKDAAVMVATYNLGAPLRINEFRETFGRLRSDITAARPSPYLEYQLGSQIEHEPSSRSRELYISLTDIGAPIAAQLASDPTHPDLAAKVVRLVTALAAAGPEADELAEIMSTLPQNVRP